MPPGSPFPDIAGAIQAAARATAREVPRLPARLPERGIDDLRVVRIEGHVDRAGLLVLIEDPGPGLAAIGGAVHAAFGVWTEGMPEGCHQHDVRVGRVDDQRANLAAVLEPDIAPGLAAVDRLVDAVAVGHVPAGRGFPPPTTYRTLV